MGGRGERKEGRRMGVGVDRKGNYEILRKEDESEESKCTVSLLHGHSSYKHTQT